MLLYVSLFYLRGESERWRDGGERQMMRDVRDREWEKGEWKRERREWDGRERYTERVRERGRER